MNTQPTVRKYKDNDKFLYVHSMFKTIQGEGLYAGVPAVFLRLYGCNLQCPSCDTDYTSNKLLLSTDCVYSSVENMAGTAKLVVITGGEPMSQDIGALIDILYSNGYTVQIETNGTVFRDDINYEKCVICCSPKTHFVDERLVPYISYFKYVIGGDDLDNSGLPNNVLGINGKEVYKANKGDIYLQPLDVGCDKKNKEYLDKTLKSCIDNGHTLCVQLHKIIGVE